MLAACPYTGRRRNIGRDEASLPLPSFLIVAWSAVRLIPMNFADESGQEVTDRSARFEPTRPPRHEASSDRPFLGEIYRTRGTNGLPGFTSRLPFPNRRVSTRGA
jgi:hypothetical protein